MKPRMNARTWQFTSRLNHPIVFWIERVVLALLLASSAYTHRANPFLFYDAFLAYRWPLETFASFLSSYLPALQLVLAALLLFRFMDRAGAWLTAIFFSLLSIAQVSAWTRGLSIDCGCFTGFYKEISLQSIGLAAILFAMSLHLACVGNVCRSKTCDEAPELKSAHAQNQSPATSQ